MRPLLRAVLAILTLIVAITLVLPLPQRMASSLIKRSFPHSLKQLPPKHSSQAPFLASVTASLPNTRTFNTSRPAMADPSSAATILEAIKYRHSVYPLAHESPISDDRIQEIVQDTLLNVVRHFGVLIF